MYQSRTKPKQEHWGCSIMDVDAAEQCTGLKYIPSLIARPTLPAAEWRSGFDVPSLSAVSTRAATSSSFVVIARFIDERLFGASGFIFNFGGRAGEPGAFCSWAEPLFGATGVKPAAFGFKDMTKDRKSYLNTLQMQYLQFDDASTR
jgi:hypothetical protein